VSDDDPAALPPGKQAQVIIGDKARWAQSRSRHCVEKKNTLPLPIIEPRSLGCPSRNLITVPTEIYLLRLLLNFETLTNVAFILLNENRTRNISDQNDKPSSPRNKYYIKYNSVMLDDVPFLQNHNVNKINNLKMSKKKVWKQAQMKLMMKLEVQ
jgi:hypothetical protein